MKLANGEAIFLKFWIFFQSVFNTSSYVISPLPGHKEGISASSIAGYNIGISNYINDENEKNATISAFKYITSKEVQKENFKNGLLVPGIFSFYKEKNICPGPECDIFEQLQLFGKPTNITNDFDEYSEKFVMYVHEYIYGNKSTLEAISKIEDITKIYYISLNTNNSYIGLYCVIVISLFIIIMLISFIFPLIENYGPFFKLIPLDFWFISVLGSILIMSIGYLEIGVVKSIKCHFIIILLSFGITFNYIPFLYKFITNFQGNDKFLKKICKNRKIFFLFFIVFDTILCSLLFIKPYEVKDIIINEGKNFQHCKSTFIFNYIITIFIMIYKGIIITIMLFFTFLEWNIIETSYDIKFIVSAIYIDLLSLIIITILNFIKISNYKWYFITRVCIFLIMGISNYFFLYGYKLIFSFYHKKNMKSMMINNVNKYFIENKSTTDNLETKSYSYETTSIDNKTNLNTSNDNIKKNEFKSSHKIIYSKLLNYHYSKGISEEITFHDGYSYT